MTAWIPLMIAVVNMLAGFFHGKQAAANKQSQADLKEQQAKGA